MHSGTLWAANQAAFVDKQLHASFLAQRNAHAYGASCHASGADRCRAAQSIDV